MMRIVMITIAAWVGFFALAQTDLAQAGYAGSKAGPENAVRQASTEAAAPIKLAQSKKAYEAVNPGAAQATGPGNTPAITPSSSGSCPPGSPPACRPPPAPNKPPPGTPPAKR